ncbi:hypothetical protein [Mesorhizobium sp. M0189]|uniref:hypothetical protein n=1 Tax=Mesorhizobium sp. M0189 TaxID=2956909 RepID=UPI00333C5131
MRRLEALRWAGTVEWIDADHWKVPGNLPSTVRSAIAQPRRGLRRPQTFNRRP